MGVLVHDAGHAHFLRGFDVAGFVVDKQAGLGRQPQALRGQKKGFGLGLAVAFQGADADRIKKTTETGSSGDVLGQQPGRIGKDPQKIAATQAPRQVQGGRV